MRTKYSQSALTIVLGYFGSLPISRLVGSIFLKFLPSTAIVDSVVFVLSFGLGYLCIRLLFNKWHTRFWVKVVCATAVIAIALIAIRIYDVSMLNASNFPG